jgi:hypothetical protein
MNIMSTKLGDLIEPTRALLQRFPWSWVAVSEHYFMRWIPERAQVEWAER